MTIRYCLKKIFPKYLTLFCSRFCFINSKQPLLQGIEKMQILHIFVPKYFILYVITIQLFFCFIYFIIIFFYVSVFKYSVWSFNMWQNIIKKKKKRNEHIHESHIYVSLPEIIWFSFVSVLFEFIFVPLSLPWVVAPNTN